MGHKDLLRQRIRQQTDEYLARGGRVHAIEPGASGQNNPNTQHHHQAFASTKPSERTPVPEIVAAIETRKQAHKIRTPKHRARRQPQKRLIYDDFGEPLRWEWVND